ncbi:MAG: thioesterase family protein [Marinilabiliales bacterium]
MNKVNVQIRFNDIDIAGHVNNAVHLYYYDYGRVQYCNKVFNNDTNWKEKGLAIVHIEIDYLSPIYLNDDISVITKIVKIGNKSLKMKQHIENNKTGIIHSKCDTVLVGFNYITQESFELPENWKELILKEENLLNI